MFTPTLPDERILKTRALDGNGYVLVMHPAIWAKLIEQTGEDIGGR